MIMRERFGTFLSRSVPRLAIVCAISGVSTACGSDALRFSENPFANPFSASPSATEITGTVSPSPLKAPTGAVQSQPLGSPVSSAPLPPLSTPAPRVAAAAPAAPAPLSGPAVAAPKGWSAQGGSSVTLGANETLATLANRYGVPEQALRAANGLPAKGQPAPGAKIIVPVYNAVGTAEAAPAGQPVAQAAPAAPPAGHRMQLVKGAQPASATVATAAPAGKAPASKPAEGAKAAKPVEPAATAKVESVKLESVKPAPAKPAVEATKPAPVPAVQAAKPAEAAAADPAETTASVGGEAFRWPAKGRVIAGFGGKPGAGNDGINIALPEGTPVKAAESGTVAYAGNELKGYGNLVLIRHPNGYVSAYAHNGELKVKRGEQVARGQTIATSGQTGNVSSPQLHFELRKGSTPVDPMPYLSGL